MHRPTLALLLVAGRKTFAILLALGGLTGFTIWKLPSYWWIAIPTAFAIYLFTLWRVANSSAKSKEEMERLRHLVLKGAESNLDIFAGDGSWITADLGILREAINRNVTVRILGVCAQQENRHFSAANKIGAQVKFYPENHDPVLRGLVMDSDQRHESVIYLVEKSVKPGIAISLLMNQSPGTNSLFNYRAKVYTSRDNDVLIRAISNLFDALWHISPD